MKKTIVTYICDICGKTIEKPVHVNYPVIFHTDQNEGKPTDPYISQEMLDL